MSELLVEFYVLLCRCLVSFRRGFRRSGGFQRFGHDVVIDLVGYRRYGHNEGDEPAYSQPTMYTTIAEHPTVREVYQAQLAEAGVVSAEHAKAKIKELQDELSGHQAALRKGAEEPEGELDRGSEAIPPEETGEPETAVAADRLRELNAGLRAVPDGFTIHPKLLKMLDRRSAALDGDEASVDWGHAELLAVTVDLDVRALLLGLPLAASAQLALSVEEGSPYYLHAFAPEDYGAHSQNWEVVQDGRGLIFAGLGPGGLPSTPRARADRTFGFGQVDIQIEPKDLRIDVYRAQGAGGDAQGRARALYHRLDRRALEYFAQDAF